MYNLPAFSLSFKYIDFGKKYFFNLQGFFYKYILSLDRHYAENNPVIRVTNFNCVRVAFVCLISLLVIGNSPEYRILFTAQMHCIVNTGVYRILNLRWEICIFQDSEWIIYLVGIVKRWVMKMCTGFMWLVIRLVRRALATFLAQLFSCPDE